MCLSPTPRDICLVLTPWKQLWVALSMVYRAQLSPATTGIYKRKETPCQLLQNGEICGHQHRQACCGAYSHGITSFGV